MLELLTRNSTINGAAATGGRFNQVMANGDRKLYAGQACEIGMGRILLRLWNLNWIWLFLHTITQAPYV